MTLDNGASDTLAGVKVRRDPLRESRLCRSSRQKDVWLKCRAASLSKTF
jgi:hypothetical protein